MVKKHLTAEEYAQLEREHPEIAAQYRPVQNPIQKDLLSPAEFEKLKKTNPELAKSFRPITKANTDEIRRMKIGRNEPCPCRSGKKYKKCCLGK